MTRAGLAADKSPGGGRGREVQFGFASSGGEHIHLCPALPSCKTKSCQDAAAHVVYLAGGVFSEDGGPVQVIRGRDDQQSG